MLSAAQSNMAVLNFTPRPEASVSLKQASPLAQDADTSLDWKVQKDVGVQDCVQVLDLWLQNWDSCP